jgi:hypothetical protein
MNRGQQALVDISGKMAERLQESLEQHLSFQPFRDGDASGYENDFHGLESFLGYNGTVDESGTAIFDARTSANLGDRFGYPDDTYAGLSTRPGYYGGGRIGETTGVWPQAPVDPEADFYSPVIINYNATSFSDAAGGNWKQNCVAAIREGLHQASRNDSKESQIDLVCLSRELYIDFLNQQEGKERIVVSKEGGLRALGFSDVVTIDGCEIGADFACPTGKGYGMSIGNMELRCLENQLMVAEGPFYDEQLQSYRFACSTLGNFKFKSPRNNFLLAPVTAAS